VQSVPITAKVVRSNPADGVKYHNLNTNQYQYR
jgi:hypothetical protein